MSMFYHRRLQRVLASPLSRNKVRLLFGARQTGKTALLRRLLPATTVQFFDLQDSALRRRLEADPAVFGREVRALPRSIRHVVVDEIQKVPALLDEVQALYDGSPPRRQFFLTGSSGRRLRTRSANLLPGRSHSYHLYPVCGWEVAGSEILEIQPARSRVYRAMPPAVEPAFPMLPLARLLSLGCLPGIRSERPPTARATLEAYVGHYLEEEIRREALVRDLGPFAVFLKLAALESGRQVNLAKLAQESGISASTLRNHYQVLVDTHIGYWLQPYARRTRKRLLTTPRFLFFDVGVRNAAAGVPLGGWLPDTESGPLLEQWVGQELIARAGYLGRSYGVSFWRTSYGVEVDYVWESPHEDIPIEVKWTERPRPADARALEVFLDQYPTRARRGLLVCRCPQAQQLTDRVRAIPWSVV